MKTTPFSLQFPITDFDLNKLPVDQELLRENPSLRVAAIQGFYEEFFRRLGGTATIAIKNDLVSVAWYPQTENASEQILGHALHLLRQGDYKNAEPLLRALLSRDEENANALYNLGMMLSDQRRLPEAEALLRRFVDLEPESSDGWTALGVAQARTGNEQDAATSLRRALEIDPQSPYALRNLGGLIIKESAENALPILRKAAELLPEDQAAQYGYAQCLLQLGKTSDADAVFSKAIQLDPLSDIAEISRTARTSIAQNIMRSTGGTGVRPDAVYYCLDGLRQFRELGDSKTRAIVFEIAMLGRSGLDINDPAKKYSLRSISGKFSGLHLVCLLYTGSQLIDPEADTGIDFSQEFAQAKSLFETTQG